MKKIEFNSQKLTNFPKKKEEHFGPNKQAGEKRIFGPKIGKKIENKV